MMRSQHSVIRSLPTGSLDVSPSQFIIWALMLLTLPLDWLASAVCAAAFHELCHAIALRLIGVRILQLHMKTMGIVLDTEGMTAYQELLCAAAGPMGSFMLLIFRRKFPLLALCAFFQGCYNLIPLSSSDGWRILRSLLIIVKVKQADRILLSIQIFIIITAICVVIYYAFHLKAFIQGFLFILFLLSKSDFGKFSCKDATMRVQ